MSRRLISVVLVMVAFFSVYAIPHASANYRITSTALDTWPSTYSAGQAIVTSTTVGQATWGSSTNNIVAVGTFSNASSQAQLRIYHKNGNSLFLDDNQQWPMPGASSYYLSGVQVADVDGSIAGNETITIGNVQMVKNQPVQSQIGVWHWTGSSLVKEKLYNFTVPGATLETRSLAVWTYNGARQIVTLGYYNKTGVTSAILGIWSWDGATFTKNTLWNWTATGAGNYGSQGYAVAAADIEGNGIPDIITVGSTSNGTIVQSEMRVWGWSGSGNPLLKLTRTWVTGGQYSVATSISIGDLQGNGGKEIVVGGQVFSYPFVKAELSVWQYVTSPSAALNQLAETNWQSSSQASYDVVHATIGDIDNSGTKEIVTVGFSDQPVGTTDVFYGAIRTWTLSGSSISLQQSLTYPTIPTALYAVAVADIDKVGRQDIVVGGQQLLKGIVEIRDVSFVNSQVSLNVNPSPALAGQSVTVSGTLTNTTDMTALSSAQILLEYANSSGTYKILATVTTDSQGRFATSFTPPGPGSYTIRATWSGDSSHMGSSTTSSLTVTKVTSIIVLSSSTQTAQPGDTVKVNGYIYPAASTTITLTYTDPNGATTIHTVTSDNTGAFSDQDTVNTAGSWTIAASWTGTSTTASSTSNSLSVQTQPQPIGISLALYGFIIAIVAAAVGGIALMRKGPPRISPTASTAKP